MILFQNLFKRKAKTKIEFLRTYLLEAVYKLDSYQEIKQLVEEVFGIRN